MKVCCRKIISENWFAVNAEFDSENYSLMAQNLSVKTDLLVAQ